MTCTGLTAYNFYDVCVVKCPLHSAPEVSNAGITTSTSKTCVCDTDYEKIESGTLIACRPTGTKILPPYPIIKGAGQTYLNNAVIELSAERSINPNNADKSAEGMTFLWECYTSITSKGCTGSDGSTVADSTDTAMKIAANTLNAGAYLFKLTATLTGATNSDGTAMTGHTFGRIQVIEEGSGPLVKIVGMLEGGYINPHWDTKLYIVFIGAVVPPADAKYEWTITPPLNIITAQMLTTTKYFTIPKGSMVTGTEYKLTCKVTTSTGSTTVSTPLKTVPDVLAGTLAAEPLEGYGFDTVFKFEAKGFKPGYGDIILYKFMYRPVGVKSWIPLTWKFQDSPV